MPIDDEHLDRLVGSPWIHKVPPRCPECGYNLTGLPTRRCPECGITARRKQLEQNAREVVTQAQRIRDINDVPRAGMVVAVVTGALAGAAVLGGFSGMARVFCFVGGILALGLGLSVLRAARIPREALDLLAQKPNYMLGIGTACLGVLLVVLSFILP